MQCATKIGPLTVERPEMLKILNVMLTILCSYPNYCPFTLYIYFVKFINDSYFTYIIISTDMTRPQKISQY